MSPRPRKASDADVFAAAVRVMGRVGPADLTLTAIAAEAGVTAGALVQRFGSKLALLRALSKGGAEDSANIAADIRAAHASPIAALVAYARCLAGLAPSPAALARNLAYLQIDLTDRYLYPLLLRQAQATRGAYRAYLAEAVADRGGGDGQRRRGAGPRRRHGRQRLVDDLGRLPGGARRRLDRTRCPGRAGTGPGRAPPACLAGRRPLVPAPVPALAAKPKAAKRSSNPPGVPMLSNLRLAVRTLSKTPFVTAIAVLSLALGIGANTAIFSLFDRMLLRPLPVPDTGALVNLAAPGPKPGSNSCNQAGDCQSVFSYPMFRDLERVQTVFTGIAAHNLMGVNLAARGQTPLSADGMLVSGSYFPTLGLQPAAGRLFTPDDDRTPGAHALVVLSHGYWSSHFAESPSVVGESLVVNGTAMTVIGVAPRGFEGTTLGTRPNVFVPISMRETLLPGWKGLDNRRSYWAYLFARLKPGVSIEQARAAMDPPYRPIITDVEVPLQTGLSDQTMARFRSKPLTLEPGERGQSEVRSEARAPLTAADGRDRARAHHRLRQHRQSAAGPCRRTQRRDGGAAVDRGQPLAGAGPAAGRVVHAGAARRAGRPGRLALDPERHRGAACRPRRQAVIPAGIDGSVLLYALGLSLATGIVFGLYPALHSTRPDLVGVLKGHSGQPSGARAASRFRTGLATSQIALVDGPAGRRRALHQEPLQRQPRRPRPGHRSAGHLLRCRRR